MDDVLRDCFLLGFIIYFIQLLFFTVYCSVHNWRVEMREESESGIRKWEKCDLRRQQKIQRDWAAVTCDGRLFHRGAAATGKALSPTVDRRVRWTSRDVDEAERSRRLASGQGYTGYFKCLTGEAR